MVCDAKGCQVSERTEVVRRERAPESFLFGPQMPYGTLTISATGVLTYAVAATQDQGRGVLRDSYCNAIVVSTLCKDNANALTSFPSFMIRCALRENQQSPLASDLVILHSVEQRGTVLALPAFCQIYAVWVFRNAAATYAAETDGIALCVNFT